MKKYLLTVALILPLLIAGCQDDEGNDLPLVVTIKVDNVTTTGARALSSYSYVKCTATPERGIVWSTSPEPTIQGGKTSISECNGGGDFTMTGLTPKTKYYTRAYIVSETGVLYGNELSFTTL